MSNIVKIGDITDSCLGKMLDAKKNKGEYHPYLANINVRWGSFDLEDLPLMRFENNEHERYGLKKGDLVMCEGGEPGRCAIWKDEVPNMKIQKALHRIRAKEDLLDIRYLYYWFLLAGKQNLLKGYFTETTIKHLPGDKLKEIELNLPSIEQQRKIADVLTPIDDRLSNNQKIIQTLTQYAKTIYDYWFVQFEFPNAEGKPYKSSGGEMFWCEELNRKIPKGWSWGNLYDIADYVNGAACQKYRPQGGEDSLPVIKIVEMHNGVSDSTERVSINIPDKHKVYSGDILFSWSASLEVMYWLGENGGLNQHIFKVNPKGYFTKEYVYHQVRGYIGNFIKIAESRKTTMGHITSDHMKQSRIVLPPESTIKHFNEMVSDVHKKIIQIGKENDLLVKQRDWLLPLLMNGQATIK